MTCSCVHCELFNAYCGEHRQRFVSRTTDLGEFCRRQLNVFERLGWRTYGELVQTAKLSVRLAKVSFDGWV